MNQETDRRMYAVSRGLLALIFLVSGIRKTLAFAATVKYFGMLGIPAPELVVALTIAFEISGAVALTIGWKTRFIAMSLALFTLAAALIGHPFWSVEPAQFTGQLNHFLKNLAMVGGFLMIVMIETKGRTEGGAK